MFNMRLLAHTSGNDNGRAASVGARYVELDDLMWRLGRRESSLAAHA